MKVADQVHATNLGIIVPDSVHRTVVQCPDFAWSHVVAEFIGEHPNTSTGHHRYVEADGSDQNLSFVHVGRNDFTSGKQRQQAPRRRCRNERSDQLTHIRQMVQRLAILDRKPPLRWRVTAQENGLSRRLRSGSPTASSPVASRQCSDFSGQANSVTALTKARTTADESSLVKNWRFSGRHRMITCCERWGILIQSHRQPKVYVVATGGHTWIYLRSRTDHSNAWRGLFCNYPHQSRKLCG